MDRRQIFLSKTNVLSQLTFIPVAFDIRAHALRVEHADRLDPLVEQIEEERKQRRGSSNQNWRHWHDSLLAEVLQLADRQVLQPGALFSGP